MKDKFTEKQKKAKNIAKAIVAGLTLGTALIQLRHEVKMQKMKNKLNELAMEDQITKQGGEVNPWW